MSTSTIQYQLVDLIQLILYLPLYLVHCKKRESELVLDSKNHCLERPKAKQNDFNEEFLAVDDDDVLRDVQNLFLLSEGTCRRKCKFSTDIY